MTSQHPNTLSHGGGGDWSSAEEAWRRRIAAARRRAAAKKLEMEAQGLSEKEEPMTHDPVDHPKHYTSHPSGVECIQVTEHMGFNLGNAVKYIWRADLKNDALEDLRKAAWYVTREIEKREKAAVTPQK